MNKILYSSGEFYLLQDWPEKEPSKPGSWAHQELFTEYYEDLEKYHKAIETSKANKIKIVNPELLSIHKNKNDQWIHPSNPYLALKDGDTFDFPSGKEVQLKNSIAISMHGVVSPDMKCSISDYVKSTVAILSKEEQAPTIATTNTQPKEFDGYLNFKPTNTQPYEKPDFEKLASELIVNAAYKYAMEKIWATYITPLQSENEALQKRHLEDLERIEKLKEFVHKESKESSRWFNRCIELQNKIITLEENAKLKL